jgi:1,4-alpha-glucan branching enzyme
MMDKVPGDVWQKAATLRALYLFMFAHPGKKLLFMGMEFGQWGEWRHDTSLDWHLVDEPLHAGLQRAVADINHTYRREPALHEVDFEPGGFAWIDCNDWDASVISFVRRARQREDFLVAAMNWTPVPRPGYRIGVPEPGFYREVLNTDADWYGGGNVGNGGGVSSEPVPAHGHPQSIVLTLPPLAGLLLKPIRTSPEAPPTQPPPPA